MTFCLTPSHGFPGGLSLPGHKQQSIAGGLHDAGLPDELVLPLKQHIGHQAEACVKVGQAVLKGEVVAVAKETPGAPVHAPTSGTISAIEERPLLHPSRLPEPCIILKPDGRDQWLEREGLTDWNQCNSQELIDKLAAAGVVGLGGAAFPTAFKLAHHRQPIHTLVINGAECEPYISCDEALMRSQAADILEGARILRHILQAKRVLLAIEDPMSEVCALFEQQLAGQQDIELHRVPSIYPEGGEKQLIQTLTGQEVPSGGYPGDIGIICQNVGTAYASYRAVVHGEPLLSRIVTVTGPGIARACNMHTLLGTPLRHLVAQAGGYLGKNPKLVMGGPMMGQPLADDELPVIKACNCLLVLNEDEVEKPGATMPCIRCGECARVCPMKLVPQELYAWSRAENLEKLEYWHLGDCIECGCCSYVCPSEIPLVDFYRHSKGLIREKRKQTEQANHARERYESRLERLEREKAARAERHKSRAKAVKAQGGDAVAEAIARAKAKKAAKEENAE